MRKRSQSCPALACDGVFSVQQRGVEEIGGCHKKREGTKLFLERLSAKLFALAFFHGLPSPHPGLHGFFCHWLTQCNPTDPMFFSEIENPTLDSGFSVGT